MHLGDVQELGLAYAAIMAWVQANGRTVIGGSAEISLVWDPDNAEASITELQLPIAAD